MCGKARKRIDNRNYLTFFSLIINVLQGPREVLLGFSGPFLRCSDQALTKMLVM